MPHPVFEIIEPGIAATLQDRGRVGWRRFGVPPGGVMDEHAAFWANRLLDNAPDAAVAEFLLQGAKLRALRETWIALSGAAAANVPSWRAVKMSKGEMIEFPTSHSGVWIYLAVEGGFAGTRLLGSVSVYGRGQLGRPFFRGDLLCRSASADFELPSGVAGLVVEWGGYPKLGLVDAADVSWLAQCRPGVKVRFELARHS